MEAGRIRNHAAVMVAGNDGVSTMRESKSASMADAAGIREQAKADGRKARPERDWISLLYFREGRVYEAA
jgi:hypothetical protein